MFVRYLYVLCNPMRLSVQMKPYVYYQCWHQTFLSGFLDSEITMSGIMLLYVSV